MDVTSVVSIRFLASRIINQLGCWWSYALSVFGIVRVKHLPTFVSIEPANYCQLRCPECPVGQGAHARHKAQNMSWATYERILSQVQTTAHTIQFYFQGEPLLNPLLPKMISRAREVGLFTLLSTNGQALNRQMAYELVSAGLNRIIVSIDGFSQESYATYRVGGSLHRALEGLQFLKAAKEQCHSSICIELQVLRLRSNEHEWQWIARNYRSLGATRLVFKTAQLYDYQNGHPLMPSELRYSRYRKQADGTYYLYRSWLRRHWLHTPCYRLWSGCVVTTTGEVLPCCYDKEGRYALGNLLEQSIASIWLGGKGDAFREQVLHHQKALSICQECNF